MNQRPLSRPEALAAAAVGTLSTVIAVGYLWGRIGVLAPSFMFAVALVSGATWVVFLWRRSSIEAASAAASMAVFVLALAGLRALTGSDWLLPGRGPDLSHHLMLVDFLERNWRLPDASQVVAMVEMAHYTPGLHLLAALFGAWSGSAGFYAVYPVVALAVALKLIFVLSIAARMWSAHPARLPLALIAVVLCVSPAEYSLGSFLHDSLLAPVVSELFAVAMFWAAMLWDARPSSLAATLFALTGVAAFLTWPMWVGPLIVTLVAAVLTHEAIDMRTRLNHLAIALTPIALVALIHTSGRLAWVAIGDTTGVEMQPAVAFPGWPLVLSATVGLGLAWLRRESRVPLLLALSAAAQALTLYVVARSRGAAVPYMAFKMVYLIVYPLAVLGTLPFGWLIDRLPSAQRLGGMLAWALSLAMAITVGLSMRNLAMPTPIVSTNLYNAGRWARAHVEAGCVDYLVPNGETMRWLHLAVLGNSRSSPRTTDPATFDPHKATVRWIEQAGLPYAIAHIPSLPDEVASHVDVLEQFGDVAVVSRRGPSTCADAQRLAADASPRR